MKKGQYQVIGVMVGVMVFFAVFALTTPLVEQIDNVQNPNNLDCANTSITEGAKTVCVATDFSLPMFAIVGLGIALSVMGGAWLLRKSKEG